MPQNVTLHKMKLSDIDALSSKKLGFQTNITRPYKLNDFKPAYGLIFSDILKTYDFWGHGDIDLVYGNIRKFMTPEILFDHDVISCRHDYTAGCFCLYKNNLQINTLFMQSRDYKQVLESESDYCFDECNYLHSQLREGYSVFDFPDNIQSMTYVVQKSRMEGSIKAYFDFILIEGTPGKIMWQKGELIYKSAFEVLLYHLIGFKNVCKKTAPLPAHVHAIKFGPKTISIIKTP